jgi:acyl-CoA synthetase (NDP forming)
MAGPDQLYEGMFRQSGIIRARSVTELFDFCWVLGTQPRPNGRKMVLLTHSGGPGAAAADACGRAGLELPPLSGDTMEKLSPFLPVTATGSNPIDLTFHKDPMHYFFEIPRLLLGDKEVDMLMTYFLLPPHKVAVTLESMGVSKDKIAEESTKLADVLMDAIVKGSGKKEKPIVGYTFRSVEEWLIKKIIARGIPVFPEPVRAAAALMALVRYVEMRNEIMDKGGKVL